MKRLLGSLNGVSLLCKTVESCLSGYLKMKTNFLKQSTLSKVQANPLVQSNHLHVKAITVQYKKNANLIPPPNSTVDHVCDIMYKLLKLAFLTLTTVNYYSH